MVLRIIKVMHIYFRKFEKTQEITKRLVKTMN